MTMRSALFVALLLLAVALALPTGAQAQTPPDQVMLTNGGMLRGTIIENMPGDHVTIQLPTGETRRFAAAEVQSAGPAQASSPVMQAPTGPAQQLPPAPYVPPQVQMQPTVTLHVTADRPRVSLHRMTGSSVVAVWTGRGVGTGIVESFELMCN